MRRLTSLRLALACEWFVGVACVTLVLGGCSGGTGSGVDDLGATLAAVDLAVANNTTSSGVNVASVAAFLSTRPEFAASGSLPDYGSAWGRLTDGTTIVVVDSPAPSGNTAEGAASVRRACSSTLREGLPHGEARVLQCLGVGFSTAASTIRSWLSTYGYTVNANVREDASIDSLMDRVRGQDAVFYISSHGGASLAGGQPVYCVATTTPVTDERNAQYRDHLTDGSLAIVNAEVSIGTRSWRYAITPKFVRDHMSFAPNSLVYIDACHSNDEGFRQACIDRGASLYAGWSGPAADYVAARAALFMFDGMLGANATDAAYDPPQRPFDYSRVYSDLTGRGWNRDTSSRADHQPTLIFTEAPTGDMGMLAPSIEFVRVDEVPDPHDLQASALLHVYGSFGEDPGDDSNRGVSVGGTRLTLVSWTPCEIVAAIPSQGAGFYGDVVVEAYGHPSNAAPLSLWILNIDYEYAGEGSARDTMALIIPLRFDVHGFRSEPGDQGWHYNPRQFDVYGAEDSIMRLARGDWESGGSWTQEWEYQPGLFATYRYTWAGSGELVFSPTAQGSYVNGTAQLRFDTQGHLGATSSEDVPKLYVRLRINAGAVDKTLSTLLLDSGNPPTVTQTTFAGIPGFEFDLPIDDSYSIPAGTKDIVMSGYTGGTLHWGRVEPMGEPGAATTRCESQP